MAKLKMTDSEQNAAAENKGKPASQEAISKIISQHTEASAQKQVENIPTVEEATGSSENQWLIKDLPSDYKFYSTKEIYGSPLTIQDLKLLASISDDNDDEIINTILQRRIRGIRFDQILVSDKMMLLLWLRNQSFINSKYEFEYKCSDCGSDQRAEFTIAALNILGVPDNFSEDTIIPLPSGNKIKIKVLRIADEIRIRNFLKSNPGIDREELMLPSITTEINGQAVTGLKMALDFWNREEVGVLDDFFYMRQYMEKYYFGVSDHINARCRNCGGSAKVALNFQADFFIPSFEVI